MECKNVSKSFEINNQTIVPLEDITFSINRGEKVIIAGKSGAGKSVLLSLLCGLDLPSSGDIYFLENRLSDMSHAELAKLRYSDIRILFQNHNLITSWNVLENVEAALIRESMSKKIKRERAKEMLSQLGLSVRINHLPYQLSIGEQQRVAIARTLILQPKLIVADEPIGDVDPETANDIIQMLYRMVDKHDTALLIATHGYPLSQADKIFVLKNGCLHQQ